MIKMFYFLLALSSCQAYKVAITPSSNIIGVGISINSLTMLGTAVENSYFRFHGKDYFGYDPAGDGQIRITSIENPLPFWGLRAYFLNYNEMMYVFYESGGDLYAQTSSDLITWSILNNGAPVLSKDASGNYSNIWNPAVAVDESGMFHMLIEHGKNGYPDIGLNYHTAYLVNGFLDFNPTKKQTYDLPLAGNPELKYLPGQGLISIHGQLNEDSIWYMTYSVLHLGQSNWITKKDSVYIYADGIHICDPSVRETTSGLTLAFSYDQNSSYSVNLDTTYKELFDE